MARAEERLARASRVESAGKDVPRVGTRAKARGMNFMLGTGLEGRRERARKGGERECTLLLFSLADRAGLTLRSSLPQIPV